MLRHEAEARLRDKAAKDPEFRRRLIADPHSAISQELGIEIPATQKIKVIEEGANESYLVLPPAFQDLSDDELEAVAGGGY